MLNIPALLTMYTLTVMCGLVVFAYYTKVGCDPLRSGEIKNPNQLLPLFVVRVLNIPGVTGMFLAVLFSGALSTISSSLNALSTVTWTDFLKSKFPNLQENKKTLITKCLVTIYGAVSIMMAFFAQFMGGHVMMATQSFAGSVVGPLAAMFYLGAFLPRCNAKGVVMGAIAGVAFGMWLAIGGYSANPHRAYLPTIVTNCSANTTIPPIPTNPTNVFPLYRISYMLYSVFAILATILIGTVVSLITGKDKEKCTDPRLLSAASCCSGPRRHGEGVGTQDSRNDDNHERFTKDMNSRTEKPEGKYHVIQENFGDLKRRAAPGESDTDLRTYHNPGVRGDYPDVVQSTIITHIHRHGK